MRCTPNRLWHDAVHEAGHAVIARALGLSSGYANLFPDCEETSGHAFIIDALQAGERNHVQPKRTAADGAFWRGKIIASMAGAEAEREIIGLCLVIGEHERRSCDLIADHLGYSDVCPEFAERMRRFTQQLVKRHRDAILSFAEQLIAAAELDEMVAR